MDIVAYWTPIILAEVSMILLIGEIFKIARQMPDYLTQLTSFYHDDEENYRKTSGLVMAEALPVDLDKKTPLVKRLFKFLIWYESLCKAIGNNR